MAIWSAILARGDGDGLELLYVIAVLILAGAGAIADKVKQRLARSNEQKHAQPSAPRRIPSRPEPPRRVAPPRPVHRQPHPTHPAAPPARPAPLARPVRPIAEGPPRHRPPAPPRRPATPRPAARPPHGPQAPPEPAPVSPPVSSPPSVERSVGQLQRRQVTVDIKTPQAAPAPAVKGRGFRRLSLAEVRRAVVLNEVLSPPIALRDPNWLERY